MDRLGKARNLSHAREKFSAAVDALATHPGSIKERLISAYAGSVLSVRDYPGGVPAGFAQRLNELHARMTAVPGDGSIAATVNAMPDDEAVECAKEIVAITWQLRAEGNGRSSRSRRLRPN